MTTKKLAVNKLLVSGFAAVALSLGTGAFASVSATNGNGNGNGHGNGNGNGNGTSQNSVGGVKLGVQQRTNVGTQHGVAATNNGNGNGHNNGGSGYGGTNVDVDNNVWVQIGNVVGGAVNITINFVNNIFS